MSNEIFKRVPAKRVRRSSFDLSRENKLSLEPGRLVPILCQDTLPGDLFRCKSEIFLRFAPMLAPILHRVNVYTHFFFVPNRLIFDDWEKFITGGEDPSEIVPFPTISLDVARPVGGLMDYLGVPVGPASSVVTGQRISALPFRAYQLIYNTYYRDQNLIEEIPISKGSSTPIPELIPLLTLRKRAYEHDYFTSALPFAQKGGEVEIPGVAGSKITTVPYSINNQGGLFMNAQAMGTTVGQVNNGSSNAVTVAGTPMMYDPRGTLVVDGASGGTINELRKAIRLQEWLEKNARGGTRYAEQIRQHFSVTPSDSRLQRPEYLGGGKSPVVISEVLQTSTSTNSTTAQGNMAGHAVAVGNTHGFTKFTEEHGYILGIMCVMPRTAYQQGIPRHFQKFDRFEYAWPSFAHLGEQPIFNRELYFDANDSGSVYNDDIFGYTPRYSEYKFGLSEVHGEMRDQLKFWHWGRIFANQPHLNQDFIEFDGDNRIFAVTSPEADHLYAQIFHNIRSLRPLPFFGTPTI